MRNYFILDGVDSRDFGVYISGQGTFSAPARSYDMISIPGRSGDLYKDNDRLENGVFTYPAFICRDFKQNIADFRAFLLSLRGYHRLVDSYHPNEYRMVSFQGEFAPDVTAKNDAASFDITFNCKPQRFLLSGEEVVTLDVNDPPSETFSGNPATFEADGEYPITDLTVDIEPIQDLNGYDNPWPAGGGKNKLAFPYAESSKTNNGVTFTVNDDGTVRINGTATARGVFYLQAADSNFHPDAGTYYVSKGSESQSAAIIVEAYNRTTWKKNLTTLGTAASVQFTIDYDGYDRVVAYISVASGNSPSNEIVKPMFRLSSVSDDTFAPYSNICPISGWTGANIHVSPTTDAEDGTTYSITFPSEAGIVYGGSLDVTLGKLTVDRANIASYNGELLPSTWISDRDVYAVGTTPTTGAQVVYKLATPIVYDLTPTEVTTLLGTNNVWSDAGAVEGKYVLPFTIENPTRFNSQPLLRVYGAGNLGINGDTITISQADVYTDIDCEMMDAYKGAENRNQYITLANYKFPVLVPGENNFSLGAGITRAEITPRWWTV